MIKRAPLSKDTAGKCNRWRVIVYNQETKKYDWHTVRGSRDDAKALERKFEDAKGKGEYTGPVEQRTFEEVADLFLDDRRANNRRTSTLDEYQSELKIRILPQPNARLPALGTRDIRKIKRADMKAHFNALRNSGRTVSQVNKSIKVAKAIFTYAFDLEYVTSNVMQRFPKLHRVDGEQTANRGVFTEAELKAIFANATAFELALVATLSISGPRPGEIYALDWSAVYLEVEKPYFRVERTWCSKGRRFYPPKTRAGRRTVPLSGWLGSILREHRAHSNCSGLVFPSSAGTPLNTANVRNRVWIPLLERAAIPYRDMYSLRWTFVSMARASGEAAFNVSRLIGHARSTIVDTIYAHTVDSGLAGVTQSVEQRMGLKQAEQPAPTDSPRGLRLDVIDGGRRADRYDQRDIRRTIDDAESKEPSDATSI
jgi:integrase